MVFLKLYNGVNHPEQVGEVDDWGFEGPTLGPFDSVQLTYGGHLKCYSFETGKVKDLFMEDGFLVHDSKYYGDFEIMDK